jgi:hypothetical protein
MTTVGRAERDGYQGPDQDRAHGDDQGEGRDTEDLGVQADQEIERLVDPLPDRVEPLKESGHDHLSVVLIK